MTVSKTPRVAVLLLLVSVVLVGAAFALPRPEAYSDQTVRGYLTERTCWWNEICKEEFQAQFKCKCPLWSFCRSPGRYYNAFCTMTGTGYIWSQPEKGWRNPAGGTTS